MLPCSIDNINYRDAVAAICAFFGAVSASSGGVGGGPIFVTTLRVIAGISTNAAVPISKAMIFAGTLVSFVSASREVHPEKLAPLIDFDLILLMEPMTIFGTLFGVIANIVVPDWVIFVVFSVLLVVVSYKILKRAIREFRAETLLKQKRKSSEESPILTDDTIEKNPLNSERCCSDGVVDGVKSNIGGKSALPRLYAGKMQELIFPSYFPYRKFMLMVLLYAFVAFTSFAASSSSSPSHHISLFGIRRFSWQFWLVILSNGPICISFSLSVGLRCRSKWKNEMSIDGGVKYTDARHKWSNIVFVMCLGFLAGFLAGFLGVGGGLIKQPVLLHFGLVPQVVSATSLTMILFTSSSTTIQFIIFGRMDYLRSLFFVGFSASGFLFGKYLVGRIVKSTGRQSVVLFMLFFILFVSFVVCFSLSVYSIAVL